MVVSNYAARGIPGVTSPIEVLPAVAEAVAGKAAILIDGDVWRGSDVLKALALGAQAVLLARPAVWGLAAYGAASPHTTGRASSTACAPRASALRIAAAP